MLDRNNPYYRQVELIMRVLPLVARQPQFALKGGTAINLFVRNLPRLSVDIDLTYLPLDQRDHALAAIENGLRKIRDDIERIIPAASVNATPGEGSHVQRLQVSAGGITIKIEVSPVLRGNIMEAEEMPVSASVADQFGYVETRVLANNELYAGKLVAALDRQHPRDLFDVKILLDHEGICSELMDLFMIYLISSNRPIVELLAPNLLPLQPVFDQQFRGMSLQPVTVEELEHSRNQMIASVMRDLTEDHRLFLLSFKAGDPEWTRLKHPNAKEFPAVRWKLQNVRGLSAAQRQKALAKLENALSVRAAEEIG